MITKQGDTWDTLSLRAYGSADYMSALIEANPGYRKIVIFPAGVTVSVPEVDTAKAASGLPPWKRKVSHE